MIMSINEMYLQLMYQLIVQGKKKVFGLMFETERKNSDPRKNKKNERGEKVTFIV